MCPIDLYCSLEVDSFGYFVNKAKTRVHRDSTEPSWNEVRLRPGGVRGGHVHRLPASRACFLSRHQEFEIELEGSQTLRLLCYEKSCNKTRPKEDGELTDRILAKGQVKVRTHRQSLESPKARPHGNTWLWLARMALVQTTS